MGSGIFWDNVHGQAVDNGIGHVHERRSEEEWNGDDDEPLGHGNGEQEGDREHLTDQHGFYSAQFPG